MKIALWALALLVVVGTTRAAPGNLDGDRRSFNYHTVDRNAYG